MSTKLKVTNSKGENESDNEEYYEVEEILEKKKFGNKWKYQVKWVGFGLDQNTWEPAENLENVDEMLDEFEKNWQAQQKNSENKQSAQTSVKKPGRPRKYISDSTPLSKTKENNSIPEVKRNKKENQSGDYSFADNQHQNHLILNKKRKLTEDEGETGKKSSEKQMASSVGDKLGNVSNVQTFQNLQTTNEKSPMLKEKNMNVVSSGKNQMNPLNKTFGPIEEAIIIGDDENLTPKVNGCFESKDVPKKLITARLMGPYNEVNCLVEWMPRENGIKPNDSFISNKILREKCPNLLLDFYESRLRFPSNPIKK
jgi:hypothetical protein